MQRIQLLAFLGLLFISCGKQKVEEKKRAAVDEISIFEIYLPETNQVDDFSLFLKDTLKLPVEWEPFDFFGDSVVYDAAFYLGNTTLELLALYDDGDMTMGKEAKYNRILFQSNNISESSSYLKKVGLPHKPPFEFNIVSENSQLTIGKQVNLDSLSYLSNINVAFWEFLPAGFSFEERGVSAKSLTELEAKLDTAFKLNPLGIVGLKEIHLALDKSGVDEWHKLLGQSEMNSWGLADGLKISYTLSSTSKGVDWIKMEVNDLSKAKEFLTSINLLSTIENQISIDRTRVFGLSILLEES